MLTLELLSLAVAANEVKTPVHLQDLAASVRAHVLPRFEQLAEDVPHTISRRPQPNGTYTCTWLPHAERAVFLGYDLSDLVARANGTPTAVYMARDGKLVRLTVTAERNAEELPAWEHGYLSLVSEGVLAGLDREAMLNRVISAGMTEASPAARVSSTPVARA